MFTKNNIYTTINWEIFPPGTIDIQRIYGQISENKNKPSLEEFADRYETIEKFNPIEFIKGRGNFNSYFGARFSNNIVAFENVYWGNALYVIYDNWQNITKTPRSELIRLNPSARRFERYMISWVKQKNEFSRGAMEKALDLTLGQSEWWVKELLKKSVIKRTKKKVPNKIGKGKPQVIYKYIYNQSG